MSLNLSLRNIVENIGLNSNQFEYCFKSCFKSDSNKLTDGEKNCLKVCQANYQILDNIYLTNADLGVIAANKMNTSKN